MERRRPDVAATGHQLSQRGERIQNRGAALSRATGELEEIGLETANVGQRSGGLEQVRGKEQTRRGGKIGAIEIDIKLIGVDRGICGSISGGVEFYERF